MQRIKFLASVLDKEKGWAGHKTLTDQFDSHVYLLTPEVKERFAIEHVPSVVTAQNGMFVVHELADDKESSLIDEEAAKP